MFEDRRDAGQKLAIALSKYKNEGVLVLAVPRGGVEVGCQVARYLKAEFSLIVARKLPYPDNPEAGFGAIAEDGSIFIFEEGRQRLSGEIVAEIVMEQQQEVKRRISILRKDQPLPQIKDRKVILVDDGIAVGSTMMACIMLCRNKEAGKIIVAAPVSGTEVAAAIGRLADETVILEKPIFFQAVAQVYYHWYDVSDQEVLEIMEGWSGGGKIERRSQ